MLNISNSIKKEQIKYKNYTRIVYYFKCLDCDNIIKSETKYLNKHSGKCRFCVHKGIPYLSNYKHFKDSVYRSNSKRKKQKDFNLSFEEFLIFTTIHHCHYCNDNIKWIKHTGQGQHRYNLDRKNSDGGYEFDNLVVCCKRCNFMKNDKFSYEEFLEVVKLLDKIRPEGFIKR